MTRPIPAQAAPELSVPTVDGGTWQLAGRTPDSFTMVVFYRGLHCPVCKGFLGELSTLLPNFEKVGTEVIAVSMDPRERAEQSVREWELGALTVGYGLTEAQARGWGLYLSDSIKEAETQVFCEPGLFLVDNSGRLYLINVSKMPFARPDIASLPDKIAMATGNGYPARGTRA